MENQVSDEDKEDRLQRLIKIQTEMSRKLSDCYLGKTVEVLVEGTTKKNDEFYTGRTDSNKVAIFKGNKDMVGKFVNLKIVDVRTWTLYGECI